MAISLLMYDSFRKTVRKYQCLFKEIAGLQEMSQLKLNKLIFISCVNYISEMFSLYNKQISYK